MSGPATPGHKMTKELDPSSLEFARLTADLCHDEKKRIQAWKSRDKKGPLPLCGLCGVVVVPDHSLVLCILCWRKNGKPSVEEGRSLVAAAKAVKEARRSAWEGPSPWK